VLLLVTLRDRDPHINERTAARLARLARDGQEIQLGPLDPDEVRTLVEAVARRALPPRTLAQLAERTGGNPLFVVECARAYRDETPTQLPASVRELTTGRIALLAEPTRAALAAGAIVGRDFSAARSLPLRTRAHLAIADRLSPEPRGAAVAKAPHRAHFRCPHPWPPGK